MPRDPPVRRRSASSKRSSRLARTSARRINGGAIRRGSRRVRRRARLLLGGRTPILGGTARTRAVQRGDSARCSALGPRRARSWSSSACAATRCGTGATSRQAIALVSGAPVGRRGSHRRVRNRAKPIAARPAHATRLFVQPRIMRQAVSAVRDLRKGPDFATAALVLDLLVLGASGDHRCDRRPALSAGSCAAGKCGCDIVEGRCEACLLLAREAVDARRFGVRPAKPARPPRNSG